MKLTPLRKKVVDLLMQDLTSKEVAEILNVTPSNISTCLERLREIYNVKTTHGLLLKIQTLNYKNPTL